ncbi:MAG: hypothetical protein GY797_28300 [Deltaproteobacteria bacterium]|nr:hypothetical protein [Deltaproteobacteria bacterium]
MHRRSFLKGMGAFLVVGYTAPLSLTAKAPVEVISGNTLVMPNEIAREALSHMEDALRYSAQMLAKKIDEDVGNIILNQEFKGDRTCPLKTS